MHKPRTRHSGVTLIEVLIAVVVLAVGMLGLAALQTSALSNNSVAYQYTQVATLAQGLIERMRANRSAVIAGNYALSTSATPSPGANCASAACTPAQMAQFDLAQWYQAISPTYTVPTGYPGGVKNQLPGASTGSVACADATCTSTSSWIVTIYWDADRTGRSTTNCDPTSSTDLNCFRLVYRP